MSAVESLIRMIRGTLKITMAIAVVMIVTKCVMLTTGVIDRW